MTQYQLLYASAGPAPGRETSGWGVLARSGDLRPDVEAELVAGVTVQMPRTMPDFPTRAQLSARPPRFRYRPSHARPGLGLWWRSVEAGADHSGRLGNVFTHALAMPLQVSSRPADQWCSSTWLSPYEPDNVRLTRAPDHMEGVASGLRGVKEWISSDRDRLMSDLPWVVDALMHALGTGRVLLRSGSVEDAWGWVALASWLMPAKYAADLSFSLGEDVGSAIRQLEAGTAIVATTDTSVRPRTPRAGVSFLDTTAGLRADSSDSREWVLGDGARVPKSPWSTTAIQLFWADDDVAWTVLTTREALTDALEAGHPNPDQSLWSAALRLAILATPGAQVMERVDTIRAVFRSFDIPPGAWANQSLRDLADEAGTPAPSLGRGAAPVASTAAASAEESVTVPAGPPAPLMLGGTGALEEPFIDIRLDKSAAPHVTLPGSPPATQPTVAVALRAAVELTAAGVVLDGRHHGSWATLVSSLPTELVLPLAQYLAYDTRADPSWGDLEALYARALVIGAEDQVLPSLALLLARCLLTTGLDGSTRGMPVYTAVTDKLRATHSSGLDYLAQWLTVMLCESESISSRGIWELLDAAAGGPFALWSVVTRDGQTVAAAVSRWLQFHGIHGPGGLSGATGGAASHPTSPTDQIRS